MSNPVEAYKYRDTDHYTEWVAEDFSGYYETEGGLESDLQEFEGMAEGEEL